MKFMTRIHLDKIGACKQARYWFGRKFGQKAEIRKVLKQALAEDHGQWPVWYMANVRSQDTPKAMLSFFNSNIYRIVNELYQGRPDKKAVLAVLREFRRTNGNCVYSEVCSKYEPHWFWEAHDLLNSVHRFLRSCARKDEWSIGLTLAELMDSADRIGRKRDANHEHKYMHLLIDTYVTSLVNWKAA